MPSVTSAANRSVSAAASRRTLQWAVAVVALVVERRSGRRHGCPSPGELGQLRHVAAGIAGHRVDDRAEPQLDRRPQLRGRLLDRIQVEVGVQLHRPAALDDQVLVRVGDARARSGGCRRGRSGRTSSRRRRPAGRGRRIVVPRSSAGESGTRSTAPSRRRRSRIASTGTSRGSQPPRIARPAAVPAAWPIAMHCAIERTEAWASWVAEKQRPATRTFAASRTSSVPNGMPTASPSGRYAQRVSAPAAMVLDRARRTAPICVVEAGARRGRPRGSSARPRRRGASRGPRSGSRARPSDARS